ncbi:Tick transposon, partial [Caligus rogercresseyi]
MTNTSVEVGAASSISLFKAPPFYKDDPCLWISSLENQFLLNNITKSVKKYLHTISNLPFEVIQRLSYEVRDLQSASKDDRDPYFFLKEEILKKLTPKPPAIFQRIEEGNGAMPLAQFINEIERQISSMPNFQSEFMKHLVIKFADKSAYNSLLSKRAELNCHELAELADTLAISSSSVFASKENPTSFSKLRKHKSKKGLRLCFYHQNFGENAHRCTTPSICQKLHKRVAECHS